MDKKTILHIIFLLLLSFALVYLTGSFFMALGIMMLLLLIDSFLRKYDNKRRREWEEQQQAEDNHLENDKDEDQHPI
jgi:hypothetical protein